MTVTPVEGQRTEHVRTGAHPPPQKKKQNKKKTFELLLRMREKKIVKSYKTTSYRLIKKKTSFTFFHFHHLLRTPYLNFFIYIIYIYIQTSLQKYNSSIEKKNKPLHIKPALCYKSRGRREYKKNCISGTWAREEKLTVNSSIYKN